MSRKRKRRNFSGSPPKENKKQKMIHLLEQQLRTRTGRKGESLTDQKITEIKQQISNLEHTLGITH